MGHRDTHAQISSSRCVSHKCTLLAALLCRHVDHTPNADRSVTRRCLALGSGCLTLFTRLQCSSCVRSVPARLNATSTLCQHSHSLAVPAYPNTTVFVLLVGLQGGARQGSAAAHHSLCDVQPGSHFCGSDSRQPGVAQLDQGAPAETCKEVRDEHPSIQHHV